MIRPPSGPGHYVRDMVYGALDGAITTLAVVMGASGASLGVRVALILGLANLVADGISMGASNYIGLKSELQQQGRSVAQEMPWRHGTATFLAFLVAGAIPLIAFVASRSFGVPIALVAAALVFFGTGSARAPFVRRPPLRCGLEMLGIGLLAAGAAFCIGAAAAALL